MQMHNAIHRERPIHINIHGYVFIKESHTEAQILEGLAMLRDENVVPGEIVLIVFGIAWTERISQEMKLTFQYHRDLGRRWKCATFAFDPERSVDLALSVMQSQVATELFPMFGFDGSWTTMNRQVATSIAFLLRLGRSVHITDFEIGPDCMAILAQGLVTPAGSSVNEEPPQKFELGVDYVRFVRDRRSLEKRTAEKCLADGLARNTTLATFSWFGSEAVDATAAMIVESLVGHPALTTLEMKDVEFGELTTRAIGRVLASPNCNVLEYAFSCHNTVTEEEGPEFDFEPFLEELQAIVRERLYLNRLSAMLRRGDQVPLSLWALALGRVSADPILQLPVVAHPQSRQANITYQFLHGPVFTARGSLN